MSWQNAPKLEILLGRALVGRLLDRGHPPRAARRRLSKIDLEDRYSLVYGHLTESDELRDEFLQAEHKLTKCFTLVKHLDAVRPLANEVIFYQRTMIGHHRASGR